MADDLSFTYRYKASRIFLAILFFGACAGFIGHEAMTNDQGLLINHIIELDPGNATVFYWVMAALCGSFVVMGLIGVIASLTAEEEAQVLRLTPTEIRLPQGLFRKELRDIPYTEVKDLHVQQVQSQRFLTLVLTSGKKVSIAASALPKKENFDTVCQFVAARVTALK